MDIRHLYPKKGDDVLDWWAKVIAWAKTLEVEIGPGMRATQGLNGLKLLVTDQSPVRTPFRVGVTGTQATVSTGFLDDRVPWILDRGGDTGARLDGTGADGITPARGGRRKLDLAGAEPGNDGRSAIVLQVRLDGRGVPLDDAEVPAALQIVHVADFSPRKKTEQLDAEGIAQQELAILYWRSGAIDRVAQVVRHNLIGSYASPAAGDGLGRVFFSAV